MAALMLAASLVPARADSTSFSEESALISTNHRAVAAPASKTADVRQAAKPAIPHRPIARLVAKPAKSAPPVALLQPMEPAVASAAPAEVAMTQNPAMTMAEPAKPRVVALAPTVVPKQIRSLPAPREVKVDPKVPTPLVRNMLVYQSGVASFYAGGQVTANGEHYNKNGLTAAHRTLPLGSVLLVTHEASGRSVVLRVNDRGPYIDGRILDLSAGAARVLGMNDNGIARVRIIVLSVGSDEQLPADVRGAVAPRHVKTQTTDVMGMVNATR